MPENYIPGTTLPYSEQSGMFAMFIPLIRATDGLTLSQVCSITGLEASTIQNWVKRGFVARPIQKKYHERQLARILLISSLRESMRLESIGELMAVINGSADDESDDIISEERLYDYFCEIIKQKNVSALMPDEIPSLVERVVSDYSSTAENAGERLKSALTVMVYAHTAAEYKQRAEKMFKEMRTL